MNRQHLRTRQILRGQLRLRCFRVIPDEGCRAFHATNDAVGIGPCGTAELFDGRLHPLLRMAPQQLQYPGELPSAGPGAMPLLQPVTQFIKDLRQLPAAVDVRMVQCRRSTLERVQIMQRIEHLIAGLITAGMRRHDRVLEYDLDPIDVAFDRHGLKRALPRRAVVHIVKADELVLVDFGRLPHAGIEPMPGERGGPLLLLCESGTDRLFLAAAATLPFLQTALTEISIEFLEVFDLRDRCRPLPLERLHPVLHHRLLVPAGRQAEQRLEGIMAGQRRVPLIELTAPAGEDRCGHGLGVVPPHLPGNAAKKLQPLRHPFRDRLSALRRQGDRERRVGIRPDQDQHVHLAAAVREIHLDLPEVRFDPLTRFVIQGNERLSLVLAMLEHEPPDRGVTPLVAMFSLEALVDPRHCVTLLRWRVLILTQKLQDQFVERTQLRSRLVLPFPICLRFT